MIEKAPHQVRKMTADVDLEQPRTYFPFSCVDLIFRAMRYELARNCIQPSQFRLDSALVCSSLGKESDVC
jgi:hypothetical protein